MRIEDVLTQIIELFFCGIDVLIVYQLSAIFLQKKKHPIWVQIVSFTLAAALIYYATVINSYSSWGTITTFLFLGIYTWFNFRGRVLLKLMVPILMTVISGILTIAVTSLFSLITSHELHEIQSNILLKTIAMILIKSINFLLLWIIQKMTKKMNSNSFLTTKSLFLYLGASIIILLLAFEILFLQNFDISDIFVMSVSLVFVVVFFVSIVLIFRYFQSKEQVRQTELLLVEANLKQESYIQSMQNQMEVMKLKHDLRNHLLTLYSFISNNQNAEATHYLETLQTHPALKSYVNSKNDTVNAILNAKIVAYPDITFNVRHDEGAYNIPMNQLTILLGNALDNAIEAVLPFVDEKPEIKVVISENEQYCKLLIVNPIKESPRVVEGKLYSSKREESVGIGMLNMEEVVRNNGGKLNYSFDDQEFRLTILLLN